MLPFEPFAAAVRATQPRLAVVLGSGLGSVPHRFEELASVRFSDVPGLVAPTIHGHPGTISLGRCRDLPLLVFRGRAHSYEGHSPDRVVACVRLAAELRVKALLLTNAAGGIHDSLGPGDLMVVRDHLFLQAANAWKHLGHPHTPAYSPRLVAILQDIEREKGRELLAGVYAAVTGPCYETPAEIRALKAMGADAVGMSTAAEADAGAALGLEVAALSGITNRAAGLSGATLSHSEVLANASRPAERISEILETILPLLG